MNTADGTMDVYVNSLKNLSSYFHWYDTLNDKKDPRLVVASLGNCWWWRGVRGLASLWSFWCLSIIIIITFNTWPCTCRPKHNTRLIAMIPTWLLDKYFPVSGVTSGQIFGAKHKTSLQTELTVGRGILNCVKTNFGHKTSSRLEWIYWELFQRFRFAFGHFTEN